MNQKTFIQMIDELKSVNIDFEIAYDGSNPNWLSSLSLYFANNEQPVTAVNMTQRKVIQKWDGFIGNDNEWHIPYRGGAA